MTITLDGTTGITTPDITSSGSLNIDASAPDNSLVVNSAGSVGIGTSSPQSKLHVYTGASGVTPHSESKLTVESSGTAAINILAPAASESIIYFGSPTSNTDGGIIYNHTSRNMIFRTGGNAERMRIDSSGDVMIGGTTSSATAKLNVYQADSSQRVVHFENTRNISSDENLRLKLGSNCDNAVSYPLVVTTGGADKLFITGNGDVRNTNGSYGAISDIKLKENIVDATPKLADLMQVKVRNYNLIGANTKQIGVVAQELETVFPGMIVESPDRDSESNDLGTTTKSVKYSVFVPMLIKAIQEQQVLITQQAAAIDDLTARVSALEAK